MIFNVLFRLWFVNQVKCELWTDFLIHEHRNDLHDQVPQMLQWSCSPSSQQCPRIWDPGQANFTKKVTQIWSDFLTVLLESDSSCDLVLLPDLSPSSDRSGLNRFFNGFSYLGTKKTTVQHFLQTSRCITINFILWVEYVLSKYLLMMLEVSKKFFTMVLFFRG